LLKKYIFICFQNPYFSKQLNYIIILLAKFYIHKTKITQKKPSSITFYNFDLTVYTHRNSLNTRSQNKKLIRTIKNVKLFKCNLQKLNSKCPAEGAVLPRPSEAGQSIVELN